MYKGSCLYGKISYEIFGDIKAVTNCYCNMCQKQHGAAFSTYGSVLKNDIKIIGTESLSYYTSSNGVDRLFCSQCGSSLFWKALEYSEWISVALGSLDDSFLPKKVKNIFNESKSCWLQL